MEDTFSIVKEMIAKKLEIEPASIQLNSNLTDIGLDSLDTFDIIFEAEDKFGIKIPNDQVNVVTISDVVNLFDRLLQEKAKVSL
ncbi:MAG: acyl carrier protein [Methylophilaceae bacterium]|nr:acyl carrier protein [Methylophilaceae bacterium]